MMKYIPAIVIGLFSSMFFLTSCHESLEEKAEREAMDFTRKYCPTPIFNYIRTDSVVFNRHKRVYTYYISFFDQLDDEEIISENKEKLLNMLSQSLRESTSLKTFLEAGFRFEYVCHSGSDPKKVLLRTEM